MNLNYLSLAIPFFIGFMILEYYLSGKKRTQIFHFEEAISNLNIGIAERMTDLFSSGLFYFFFKWLYDYYSIFNIKSNLITWVVLFLVTDFIWYWYHRFGHKVNILWSVHVVHHQSDDFNYTTSVRVTLFQSIARSLFWSILPIIGFPPSMVTIFLLVHGAYPFFTHTQLIGKLGVLEYFLVTPSHHRVHHSSNPEYLDKNYGDILIIWDRIFGTFAEEKSSPVYGLTKPLYNYSFLWQMFHFQAELLYALKNTNGILNKFKVLFGKPDDIDPRIRTVIEKRLKIHRRPKLYQVHNKFVFIQTFITLVICFLIILFVHYQSLPQLWIGFVFVLLSIINIGAILEQRRRIFFLEYLRLLFFSAYILITFPNELTLIFLTTSNLFILIFSRKISVRYHRLVFK